MVFNRARAHGCGSVSWVRRTGGKVSLNHYETKVAGGHIASRRFRGLHHRGYISHHPKHMKQCSPTVAALPKNLAKPTAVADAHKTGAGAGIVPPGNVNYGGLGATKRTSIHSINHQRKRIYEEIEEQINKKLRKQ